MPTHFQGDPSQVLALETFIKLTRSVTSFMNRLIDHQTLGELTESQFGVLEAIYHLGPICKNELGDKILKSSRKMTLVIDNLEKKNLVVRELSHEDHRRVIVRLTSDGEQLIEDILPGHVNEITAEMSALTPAEQERLGELCRKLSKKILKISNLRFVYIFT